ncbi:hypothetical protein Taro_010434, partial [Colocasia esculenta]|nr:hypothetical protein [Colocasia esculenta]
MRDGKRGRGRTGEEEDWEKKKIEEQEAVGLHTLIWPSNFMFRRSIEIYETHPQLKYDVSKFDQDRLPAEHASSATFPFFLTTRGKIDPGSAFRYITTLVHTHIPGPVDAWREFPVPVRDSLL